jgi:hypothetical protein
LTHRDRLLQHIRNNQGLDDDQLSYALQIIPRQTVNIICRQLESEKLIIRTKTNGKIRNFPADSSKPTESKIEQKAEPAINNSDFQSIALDDESSLYFEELSFLISLKEAVSLLNNRIHSRAVRLSLKYLKHLHQTASHWDTREGSDSGVDLVGTENDEVVVVGEVKTTIPYYSDRLGAKQAETIKKDLEKLETHSNAVKYFFVLDEKALSAVIRQFGDQFKDVKILALDRCYS